MDEALAAEMRRHVCAAYPEEGCGVLLGRELGDHRRVERIVAIPNQQEQSRHNRYQIAPDQLLRAEREARASGLEILGFFHSHPDHPARPSAFDLEHAWPYYSYVIVSVEQGVAQDTRCFRLEHDRSRFDSEPLSTTRGVMAQDVTSPAKPGEAG